MTVLKLPHQRTSGDAALSVLLSPLKDSDRVYAIAFDLDTGALERHYPSQNWRNAYDDIARELRQHNFQRMQGSVYFGSRGTNSVSCVLATQALSARYKWFSKVVRDIRMLRIEEENDLMPAVGQLDLPLA